MSDPIAVLAQLPDVATDLQAARHAVDALLWNREARSRGVGLSTESTLLGAWADAAFEGAEVPQASLRSGALEDSPLGRTAARTLAMYAGIPAVADLMTTAPLQALARLHAIVAVGSATEVGRPRAADDVPDPLRSGTAVPATEATARLAGLARLLTRDTSAPALAVAAIAHAEVAVAQPFAWGSGLVARALTRVVMRAKGVDPDGWTIPEAGLRMFGRPRYVKALRAYASGEPEGVAEWLRAHSQWVTSGAAAATELVPDLPVDG